MRVVVLGHRGMLGQMVVRYFEAQGASVDVIDERFTFTADCAALDRLAGFGPAVILNCAGRIKQKDGGRQDLFDLNAVLPLQLHERMRSDQFLVHPSTDCVFSGTMPQGRYAIDHQADALDDYGWSKRLGEVALAGKPRVAILRTSIIGPDWVQPEAKGLLGWFLRQPRGATLTGFDNHWWNGITTLEWCRLVDRLFVSTTPDKRPLGLMQPGTAETSSKFDMMHLFQNAFDTDFTIIKGRTEHAVNRVLQPTVTCPPLDHQLRDLAVFMNAAT